MELNLPTWEDINDAPPWLLKKIISAQDSAFNPITATGLNAELMANTGFSMPADATVKEGCRNSFLTSAAGWLQKQGLNSVALTEVLQMVNIAKCQPPLHTAEIESIARSIHRYIEVLPTEEDDWPQPQVIEESLPTVRPLNLLALPPLIARYVNDVAERMSCPVDFPAVAAVTALGSAIGSRIYCKPYSKGTWLVPGSVWGMVVSPPSAIKSPPLSEMLRPLRDMDKKAAEQYGRDLSQYGMDKAVYDHAIKEMIKKGGSNSVAPVAPHEPKMKRHVVNDTTYEMLVTIASANPDGFLIWRDELIGWFHSLNKDNQKEARGLYLTGWSGTESYATDRIGRGHVRADRVTLSLLGTIQPNVLRSVVYDAVAGGIGDDGLVARFQLAVFPDMPRNWVKVDRYPDLEAMQHYEQLVEQLSTVDPKSVGAEFTPDGVAYLSFCAEAQERFDNWRERLEIRLREENSDEHPAILAHLGKYRSLFPKLALILHLADGGAGPISRSAAIRAEAWVVYLENHARRIYHSATNKAKQCACALANKIKANKLPEGFTRSNVLTKEWANLRTAEEVGIALTVLKDMYWLHSVEDKRTGGRPAEYYYINPRVKRAA